MFRVAIHQKREITCFNSPHRESLVVGILLARLVKDFTTTAFLRAIGRMMRFLRKIPLRVGGFATDLTILTS